MILIGENINVMSNTTGTAMKSRDPKPIQDFARAETKAGVDYLDINIRPAAIPGYHQSGGYGSRAEGAQGQSID
jgi:5-methyltetrahydrofolate corrinoid/iron sulfur protein methyltransferase